MCGLIEAATIGGTLFSVAGQVYAGQQQKKLADRNAKIDRLNAKNVRERADLDKDRMRRNIRLAQGDEDVAVSGSGIQKTGTPLTVFAFNAEERMRDLQIFDYNTDAKEKGFLNRANTSEFEGEVAQTASIFRAGSTLFKGVTQGQELGVFG